MTNYKRVFNVVMIVLVLVATVMACTTPTPMENMPVHITMWSIAIEAEATRNAFVNAVSAYNANHQDVQIDVTYIESESFKTQLQVAIAAGDPPYIFQDWGGGVLQSCVDAGVVREIEALGGEASDIFRPVALGPSTFDGKHYAVPVDLVFTFFFYNKNLFEQYNVQVPATWSEFLSACEDFRAVGIVPAAVGNKERWPGGFYTDSLVNRIGGQDAYERATYDQVHGGTFTDPAFVQAWARLHEAVESGCFEEGVNGSLATDAGVQLVNDQAAMQLQGTWMTFFYRDVDEEFTNNNLDIFPFPVVKDGVGNPSDLMGGTGQAMVISASAPPEAEAALIEMLGSEQFAKDLADAALLPAAAGYDHLFANDPITIKALEMLEEADSLHLLYATDLPPQLADVYWNGTQQIFGLATTPEQAAADMQAVAQELNSE